METNLDSIFKTNQNLEKEGKWVEVSDTVKFLVKRFGGVNSHALKSAMARFHKPFARQIDLGTLTEEKTREIHTKVFIATSLKGWQGVMDSSGKEIPFTEENALNLLMKLPDLADFLYSYAAETNNYREDLGNS